VDIVALLLCDVGIRPVHGLDMLPEGTGVCVPLCAARDFTDVGFLSIQVNLGLYLEQAQIFQVQCMGQENTISIAAGSSKMWSICATGFCKAEISKM